MGDTLQAAQQLHTVLRELPIEKIEALFEIPKHAQHGDLAFPCFELAKIRRQSPQQIAATLVPQIQSPLFAKVEAVGPYVNFFFARQPISESVVRAIQTEGEAYGNQVFGVGKMIVIDYSSPNIAKPFSMGHLRSTVIGNALKHISKKCGYQVVGINYIGDWGTQFGKLIAAYKLWGDEERVKKNPIGELLALYVRFHEEMKTTPALAEEGRTWFKKLEDGNEEALSLWTWFRSESMQEFSRIYELLGVKFDSFNGEAFYNGKMEYLVQYLETKHLLVESDGAQVVMLENMPPCLIKKSDGATLYATRDLTAAMHRQGMYKFDRALYVVGGEQTLHFQQLFAVLKKMEQPWVSGLAHVPFGLILKDGKKMSTRKGKVIFLEDVIHEAVALAKKNIEEKNPTLQNKQEIATQVGVGAILFHDLKNERMHNIEFSLEHMLKFEGETGPYVQYTHVRTCSILKKATRIDGPIILEDDASWMVVKLLQKFPSTVEAAFARYEPSHISKYLLHLAQAFNTYYGHVRILEEDEGKQSRLALVHAVKIVLAEGLRLLGIASPEEM